jgi:hypothetical protein
MATCVLREEAGSREDYQAHEGADYLSCASTP